MIQSLQRVKVEDFQSIASAEVEFASRPGGGGITTIVGPSSTGKSALLRALALLVHNTGAAHVRAGAKSAKVTLTDGAGNSVGIERGKSLSAYTLTDAGEEPRLYAKAGTTVPEAVEKFLGLRTDTPDVHFSFQFDRPYLLAEPGSTVSRVIGELTNANVLSAAVKEGARRRLRASQMAQTRKEDAKALVQRVQTDYAGLKERVAAAEESRGLYEQALGVATQAKNVARLFDEHSTATAALTAVQARIKAIPQVDDELDAAGEILERVRGIDRLCAEYEATGQRIKSAELAEVEAKDKASGLEKEHAALLKKLGHCPTCGVDTRHLHPVA